MGNYELGAISFKLLYHFAFKRIKTRCSPLLLVGTLLADVRARIPGIRKRTPYTVKIGYYITKNEMLLAYARTLAVQCWMLNVVP